MNRRSYVPALTFLCGLSGMLASCGARRGDSDHHQQGAIRRQKHLSAAGAASQRGVSAKGGMPHRFADAERWAEVFESPDRDAWQRPDAVLGFLALQPQWLVADIGAGTGYFSLRIAGHVARVWGVDIEAAMVDYLRARAAKEKVTNLTAVHGEPGDPQIPKLVDLIFVCNTYHHISDRVVYFRALRKRLRAKGALVIVDFKGGEIPVGPPEAHRIAPREVEKELVAAGYRLETLDEQTLPYQYMVRFKRGEEGP